MSKHPERTGRIYDLMDCGYTFIQAAKIVDGRGTEGQRYRAQEVRRGAERAGYLAQLAAWTHPAGTPVIVTRDDGSELHTRTRSHAWAPGGEGTHPTVLVEGITGGYSLARVRLDDGAQRAPLDGPCASTSISPSRSGSVSSQG